MKMFILLIGDKVKVTVESKLFLYLASKEKGNENLKSADRKKLHNFI